MNGKVTLAIYSRGRSGNSSLGVWHHARNITRNAASHVYMLQRQASLTATYGSLASWQPDEALHTLNA